MSIRQAVYRLITQLNVSRLNVTFYLPLFDPSVIILKWLWLKISASLVIQNC